MSGTQQAREGVPRYAAFRSELGIFSKRLAERLFRFLRSGYQAHAERLVNQTFVVTTIYAVERRSKYV